MKQLIQSCLREYGVLFGMKSETIESYLDFYRVIFMNKDERICKIEFFYNESDLFGFRQPQQTLIGEADEEPSLKSKIIDSIQQFDSFEDAMNSTNKAFNKRNIDKFLETYMNMLVDQINCIEVNDITITAVKVFFKPSCQVFIKYEYEGVLQSTLKAFIGEPLDIYRYYDNERRFIKEVNNIILGGSLCRM